MDRRSRLGRSWLVAAALVCLVNGSTAAEPAAADAQPPLRLLTIATGANASRDYPDFAYFSRAIGAELTYWHDYPREWDVYHRTNDLAPIAWRQAQQPLNEAARQRLRDLLAERWDLVCWTGDALPAWARAELVSAIEAGTPLIRFGRPEQETGDDRLARLLAACRPAEAAAPGIETPAWPHALPQLRAAPDVALWVCLRDGPFGVADGLPFDALEIEITFWREAVARVCGYALPAAPAVTVPPRVVHGDPVTVEIAVVEGSGQPFRVVATAGRDGAGGRWQQELATAGRVTIPTAGFAVGEWLRVEIAGSSGRPAVHWVEVASPISLKLSTDRSGADWGETIAITVSGAPEAVEPPAAPVRLHVLAADRTGRIVWQETREAHQWPMREEIAFRLPELPVDRYAYYLTAWVVSGERSLGRASGVVYHYRPWDMRREWQWSAWCPVYRYQPYQARAAMDLLADAGFNSLGFGYATARSTGWAERYGWRLYAELAGGYKMWNAPVVNWADDTAVRESVRAQMDAMFKYFGGGWRSAALVLGSLGEEPGFEKGWGRTYYWDSEQAPPPAQAQFQQFLRERHGSLAAVSEAWGIPLADWSAATLDRRFALVSKRSTPIPMDDLDELAAMLDDAPDPALNRPRCRDSQDFFPWYHAKVAAFATEKLHELNPGARTFFSLAGPDIVTEVGEAACHHIHYPREFQAAIAARERLRHDGMPAFSLIWNHFDDEAVVTAGLWSQVANQVTHTNLWLGFPLVFNDDLSYTRAAIATKRFLREFQPVAPLLARATVVESTAALLDGPFVTRKGRGLQAAYAALAEAGMPPAFVDASSLDRARLVFAAGATDVGPELAEALRRYVEAGGVLVTTAGFAVRNEAGVIWRPAPGAGLADWLGFTTGAALVTGYRGLGDEAAGGPFTVGPEQGFPLRVTMAHTPYATALTSRADDLTVLASFADGTPAVVTRRRGKGAVYHLNALHAEWGWSTLYHPDREALRRLLLGIALGEGIQPPCAIESRTAALPSPSGMPWWGSQLFRGQDDTTHYLVVFADHRAPQLTGRVRWPVDGWALSDLLTGADLDWSGRDEAGAFIDLILRPGHGRILRLVPPGAQPESLAAAEAPPAQPAFTAPSTMLPVLPGGWPSEQWSAATIAAERVATILLQLRDLYAAGGGRRELSAFLFEGPARNRHALVSLLNQADWRTRVPVMARLLNDGEQLVLTGEDLGLDPATGLTVAVPPSTAIEAVAELGRLPGARWQVASADGQLLQLTLGPGRLLLDRTSLDSVVYTDDDFAAWHRRWWDRRIAPALASSAATTALAPPAADELRGWIAGERHFQASLSVDCFARFETRAGFARPLLPIPADHQAVLLELPQGCRIEEAELTVLVESNPGFGNADFEHATATGYPVGMRGTHGGSAVVTSDSPRFGQHCLGLQPAATARPPLIFVAPLSLGPRDVNLRGTTYTLGMWVKAENLLGMDVAIRSMAWGKPVSWDHEIRIPVGSVPAGTSDWQRHEWSCVLPDTRANYMDLHIRVHGGKDTRVWLDRAEGAPPPAQIGIDIGEEPELALIAAATAGVETVVREGLAERLRDYYRRAPVNDNGMVTIPLRLSVNGPARMTLAQPRIRLSTTAPGAPGTP